MSVTRMTCEVTSGSGTDFYAGVWWVTKTPKLVTFKLAEPPKGLGLGFIYNAITTMRCSTSGGPHGFRDWGDGTYTVYPNRNGTPYVFKPEEQREQS